MENSFFSDFKLAVLRPKEFINSRFLTTPRARIERLGFSSMMFGLVAGNLMSLALCFIAAKSFLQNPEPYIEALKSLGINQEGFVELIALQKAHSLLLIILSPFICFMVPHIYGGLLFLLFWILMPLLREKLDFFRIMDVASISICGVAYYAIPLFGPLIAIILVAINSSRALMVSFQIGTFMRVASVILAVYFCFFLGSATLQLAAAALVPILQRLHI